MFLYDSYIHVFIYVMIFGFFQDMSSVGRRFSSVQDDSFMEADAGNGMEDLVR